MAVNLATKAAQAVLEVFKRESYIAPALSSNTYTFKDARSLIVKTLEPVDMTNYTRTGTSRYGTPSEIQDTEQTLTVTQDRAFTFTIDKGNNAQDMGRRSAAQALVRQLNLKVIPEYDSYCMGKLVAAAQANTGHSATTGVTKSNAYEMFLNGQEALANAHVPISGRVCFASYHFINLLKQSTDFMKASDEAYRAGVKGTVGEVDGQRIIAVPSDYLPTNASFIMVYPGSVVAPKQLWEYRMHTDPPGINGWLCEGRFLYDCFVLNTLKDGIYYHGPAASGGSGGGG